MSNITAPTMISSWDEVRDYYAKWLVGMGLDYDEMAKMGDQIRQRKLKG